MTNVPKVPAVKVRTARDVSRDTQQYVVVKGAPKHYVSGYGVVGEGDIVTLDEGVTPGKWLQAVNPSDVQKVVADESSGDPQGKRDELAEAAAERARKEAEAEEAKKTDAAKNAGKPGQK